MHKYDFLTEGNPTASSDSDSMLDSLSREIAGGNRSAAAVDLEWLDGEKKDATFDPQAEGVKNPNNIKPQLELQWEGKGFNPIYKDSDNSGEVERNLGEQKVSKDNKVIKFARDMMNSGVMGRKLAMALKKSFTSEELESAREPLTAQLKYDGIIGTVAVDARGYRTCSEAMKFASKSPYKGCIKHVIGCSCKKPLNLFERPSSSHVSRVARNSTDTFLASGDVQLKKSVSICPVSNVRIAEQEIGEDYLEPTITDSLDMAHRMGAGDEARKACASKKTASQKVAAIFKAIDSKPEKDFAARYAGIQDNSQFVTEQTPVVVDVSGAFSGIDVNEQPVIDSEFAGGDVISFDEQKKPEQIPVDMKFDEIV